MTSPVPTLYQIKVSLRGISPMIWRRLLVASDTSIAELHHVLQIAVGWEDYHLHKFDIHGKEYGISRAGGVGFADDPRKVLLSKFEFAVGDSFFYEYDFGDSWEHEIRFEKIVKQEEAEPYPICIDGKRACPPEDCGGSWRYMEILHVLKSRSHPEKSEVREEVGASFKPDVFSRRQVNVALKRYWKARAG